MTMDSLTALVAQNVALYLTGSLLGVICNICFMLAIGFDCKAKGIKSRTAYMVFAFFFPLITGIVYLCKKGRYNAAAANMVIPDRDKSISLRKIFLAVAIVAFIASSVATGVAASRLIDKITEIASNEEIISDADSNNNGLYLRYAFDINGENVFYDAKGKSYSADTQVPFYDEQGRQYTLTSTDDYEMLLTDATTSHNYFDSYVTADGFVIFDDDGSFTANSDFVSYTSDSGERCYAAMDVSWNEKGELINGNGERLG